MGAYDASLGALLVGTWANTMLYMFEVTQVRRCFKTYPNDSSLLKAAVWAMLVSDTVCTISSCMVVYMYTVTFWGDGDAITRQYWCFCLYCATTGTTAFIVQMFLIYRFYGLSQARVLTGILVVTSVLSLAGGIWTAIGIYLAPLLSQRDRILVPVSVWFTSSTSTDALVAVGLVYQLRKVKSNIKTTKALLRRLTALTVSTGCVTGIWSLLVLGFYLRNVEGSIAVMINFCFGRVYALTMTYNLNSRKATRAVGASTSHTLNPATMGTGTDGEIDVEGSHDGVYIDHVVHTVTETHIEMDTTKSTYNPDRKTPSDEDGWTPYRGRV